MKMQESNQIMENTKFWLWLFGGWIFFDYFKEVIK